MRPGVTLLPLWVLLPLCVYDLFIRETGPTVKPGMWLLSPDAQKTQIRAEIARGDAGIVAVQPSDSAIRARCASARAT
jgi:hypothetical protein